MEYTYINGIIFGFGCGIISGLSIGFYLGLKKFNKMLEARKR